MQRATDDWTWERQRFYSDVSAADKAATGIFLAIKWQETVVDPHLNNKEDFLRLSV